MALDRDLGVAALRAALPDQPRARGAELFAATGVRGLRLLGESGRFERFLLVERNPAAVSVLARNAKAFPGAQVVRGDARAPPVRGALDYIDLDPFGSPAPYVDAALRLVRPEGLLAVTATDMPVLTGVARGVAESRYGGRPIRGRYGPEGGLRLLLAHLAARARNHARRLRPLLAYVQDHHLRVVARLDPSDAGSDPVGLLDPGRFDGPALPPGGPYGPLWLGPLFDPGVVAAMHAFPSAARPRELERWLDRFRSEADIDAPFYYEPNEIASAVHLPSPPAPDRLVAALRAAGFRAGRSHVREAAIRSDAPRAAVESLARRLGG